MSEDNRTKRERICEAMRRARATESDEARDARLASSTAREARRRAAESDEARDARLLFAARFFGKDLLQ